MQFINYALSKKGKTNMNFMSRGYKDFCIFCLFNQSHDLDRNLM